MALHEVTHRVQFTAVPWLRGHLSTEIDALVDATDLDPDAVRERLSAFVSQLGSALRGGEGSQGILGLIQSPAQKDIIERLTAFMSLVEGHAEYVMNAVGPDVVPSIAQIRERFGQRRKGTGPVDRLLRRAARAGREDPAVRGRQQVRRRGRRGGRDRRLQPGVDVAGDAAAQVRARRPARLGRARARLPPRRSA